MAEICSIRAETFCWLKEEERKSFCNNSGNRVIVLVRYLAKMPYFLVADSNMSRLVALLPFFFYSKVNRFGRLTRQKKKMLFADITSVLGYLWVIFTIFRQFFHGRNHTFFGGGMSSPILRKYQCVYYYISNMLNCHPFMNPVYWYFSC